MEMKTVADFEREYPYDPSAPQHLWCVTDRREIEDILGSIKLPEYLTIDEIGSLFVLLDDSGADYAEIWASECSVPYLWVWYEKVYPEE